MARQGKSLTQEQVSDQAFLCWPQLTFLLGGPVPQQQSPRFPTCSLSSTPWPGTPAALLFPPRLLQGQTNILHARKPFWFCSTTSPCPKRIQPPQKTTVSLFWSSRHHLPFPPEVNTAAQLDHLQRDPVCHHSGQNRYCLRVFALLSLRPSFLQESFEIQQLQRYKTKRGFDPIGLFSTPLLQGRNAQGHFLYLPFSEKSEEDNQPSLQATLWPPPSWI